MIQLGFKRLVIQGFRSFQDEVSFILDRKPGLYFIGGLNLAKPKLGSNAVGKSTIWDALIWCLYGKTIEGLRGHVIKNTKSKVTKVSIHLIKNEVLYTITRTHAPNSLTISPPLVDTGKDHETVSQADLDQFIGLDYQKFLYVMVVGQFNATFMELDPKEKLDIFTPIMDLSLWEKCAKAASTFLNNGTTNKNLLEAKRDGIQGRLSALKAERDRQKASAEQFQKERDGKIQSTKEAIDENLQEAMRLEADMLDQKNSTVILEKQIAKQTEALALVSGTKEIKYLEYKDLSNQVDNTYDEIKRHQTDFNKWKDLNTCPYCTQSVEPTVSIVHKKEHTLQILTLNKQAKVLVEQQNAKYAEALADEETIKSGKQTLTQMQGYLAPIVTKIRELDIARREMLQSVNLLKGDLEKLQSDADPFSRLTTATEKNISTAETELAEIQIQVDAVNKELTSMAFWVKGFKELRLWLLTDALMALDIETNNAIAQLGLPDWKIKSQMERETSSGDISKGFFTMIHSPDFPEDEYVPLKVYSGGEKQRLKLGGVTGFASLIEDYKGISLNIGVWDEPSSYLSNEGIEDLLQHLHQETVAKGKTIYLVDQRHLENALFESVITVEMDKAGSHIKEGV